MSVNTRRKHKAMERALRKKFESLPPHFKFKVHSSFQDTFDSIVLPSGYTKPTQADLETQYNSEITEEETRAFREIRGDLEVLGNTHVTSNLEVVGDTHVTSNLEVGTANLYVDVLTSRVGIGKTDPTSTLDVVGDISIPNDNFINIGNSVSDNHVGGINWNGSSTNYNIRKTSGSWSSPNYQQLEIFFPTGIILKAQETDGTKYGKSYVDIQGHLHMNGVTMSKPPRVIHIDDTRSGCPPSHAANTPIMQYSLTLSRTAYVYVSVTTILNYTSRADCFIYFGSALQQNHLTASDNTSWNPVNITAGGSLGAGTHTIKFQCSRANVVGCGADWGGMQILVFET